MSDKSVTFPTREEIRRIADELGLGLGEADVREYAEICAQLVVNNQALDALPDPVPTVRRPPATGWRPGAHENPYNAWYYKTAIAGAPGGKLSGKTVVLKDNIMLAGVPMMNGTSLLEGYVPDVDASVVARVLAAGGAIVGKAHCEALCCSAGSHTNATGPVRNPRRPDRSAGGSSSGCAVLVAVGEADMAIGCDQGGSIRVPAAACGIYGMKPTWGLVPYTGILPIEPTLDHAGPMTGSVQDNALLLEVLAGPDGYDPRQGHPVTHRYTEALGGGVAGMRIGLVREGFGHPLADPAVEAKVREAAALFAHELGATVDEVSIPLHRVGPALAGVLTADGLIQTLVEGDGFGAGRSDLYVPSLMEFLRGWQRRGHELSEPVRVAALLGAHVRRSCGLRYYAKAINVARALTAEYDAALARCDALLMPTMPMVAPPLPAPGAGREEILRQAFEPVVNTSATNVTHHPAFSLPCGTKDGLPVAMMLIGRHWDEPTLYRLGHAFACAVDWSMR